MVNGVRIHGKCQLENKNKFECVSCAKLTKTKQDSLKVRTRPTAEHVSEIFQTSWAELDYIIVNKTQIKLR